MQGETMGFNLMDVQRGITWDAFLFFWFLILLLAVVCFRLFLLARQLWPLLGGGLPSKPAPGADSRANQVAAAGLAGRLSLASLARERSEIAAIIVESLKTAEPRFAYLWATCRNHAEAIKRLGWVTLFVSFVEMIWRASENIRWLANDKLGMENSTLFLPDLLSNFGAGLIVCAFAYTVWAFADGALARRQASWNDLCGSAEKFVSEPEDEPKSE